MELVQTLSQCKNLVHEKLSDTQSPLFLLAVQYGVFSPTCMGHPPDTYHVVLDRYNCFWEHDLLARNQTDCILFKNFKIAL